MIVLFRILLLIIILCADCKSRNREKSRKSKDLSDVKTVKKAPIQTDTYKAKPLRKNFDSTAQEPEPDEGISKKKRSKTKKKKTKKKKSRKQREAKSKDRESTQFSSLDEEEAVRDPVSRLYESVTRSFDRKTLRDLSSQLPFSTGNQQLDETITAAYVQLQNNDLDSAESIFRRVLDIRSDAMSAVSGLSALFRSTNRVEEALMVLSDTVLISAAPALTTALSLRAELYLELGREAEALSDLDAAVSVDPRDTVVRETRAKALMRTGALHEASLDFASLVSLDPDPGKDRLRATATASATARTATMQLQIVYYYLADVYFTMGMHESALRAVAAGLARFPTYRPLWILKVKAQSAATRWRDALDTVAHVLKLDPGNEELHRLRGSLLRSIGCPLAALQEYNHALAQLGSGPGLVNVGASAGGDGRASATARLEALEQSALCLLALGRFGQAVEMFSTVLSQDAESKAWYGREVTAYWWMRQHSSFESFNVNREIHKLVRAGYLNETQAVADVLSSGYRSLVPSTQRKLSPKALRASPESLRLLSLTANMGKWVQLDCEGFMPSVRQHRQFGLAVLEMAQTIRKHLSLLRNGGRGLQVPDVSSSRDVSAWSEEAKSGCDEGHHWFSYRDLMDIAVRWRQLADPNDNVFWFDFRPRAEQGFMLSTPLLHGDIDVGRYAANIPTALQFLSKALEREYFVGDDIFEQRPMRLNTTQRSLLSAAVSSAAASDGSRQSWRRWARDLYDVVGEGFWAVVRVRSMLEDHSPLEATRVVLTEVKPTAVKRFFSMNIRTPSSAERMAEYEVELEAAFQRLVKVLSSDASDEESVQMRKEGLKRHALELFYYWANFAPLTRGTAATGYALLLSSVLAGGYVVGGRMPKQRQLDWEAIFTPEPEDFHEHGQSWLEAMMPAPFPAEVLDGSEGHAVADVINTPGKLIAVVSKMTGVVEEEELPFLHNGVLLDKEYAAYLTASGGSAQVADANANEDVEGDGEEEEEDDEEEDEEEDGDEYYDDEGYHDEL